MRQLIIQVPRGNGKAVIDIAKSHNGANLARFEGNAEEPIDVVIVHLSNQEVGKVLDKLQDLPKVQITLIPTGVMTLQPPASEAPQQVVDVEERSPIEIFLSGLQSVGSWRGFLGYAALAGFVVWIGLYTNTAYLLVAAMLIAPFAGPAMNTAIATGWGDRKLLGRSILRYFAALAVTIATTWLLSLILRQEIPTSLMVESSQISAVAVILPLALVITVIALAGLLTWQFSHSPNLQRSSLAQRANAQVQKTVEQVGLAKLVESNVRFTRSNIQGQDTLLSIVYVQHQPGVTASSEEIRSSLTQSIQTQLLKQDLNVTPLVDINVLETPASKQ
jgi:uncharacterized membrane protein